MLVFMVCFFQFTIVKVSIWPICKSSDRANTVNNRLAVILI